ncbi:ABC transporter permease [Burkholderia sp. Bp8963]|uniref:ABC transporter permease n=1 Tax=Burkholderia sp. Bp8963 TaxID=2184547 RepID=UPI000F5A6A87|nr:ABC transporter permease [Burkholderia sp. Bp8963]RQS64122.1 ABC transporter permease [Burkholderia sp. Bp8963]
MPIHLPRLIYNELAILVRDSSVLFWIFLFPLFFMFMLLFAFGSSGSLPQQTIEIVDLDGTQASARYIAEIRRAFAANSSTPGLIAAAHADTPVRGDASRITIPDGFGRSLELHRPIDVSVSYAQDGLGPQLVTRVLRAVSLHFQSVETGEPELIDVRADGRGSRGALAFVHYVLTGTMVMAMMSAGMTSICVALAYRRERNGFKMLACMPLGAFDFLFSMLAARLIALIVAAFVVVLCAQHLFGIPLVLTFGRVAQGSVVMIVGGTMLLSLGMALGSRLSTVSDANFVTGLAYIGLLFLSDLTMPLNSMPVNVANVMAHLPPALFVHTLRDVFVQADGLGQHWPSLAEMAGWTTLFAVLALVTFRWHRQ